MGKAPWVVCVFVDVVGDMPLTLTPRLSTFHTHTHMHVHVSTGSSASSSPTRASACPPSPPPAAGAARGPCARRRPRGSRPVRLGFFAGPGSPEPNPLCIIITASADATPNNAPYTTSTGTTPSSSTSPSSAAGARRRRSGSGITPPSTGQYAQGGGGGGSSSGGQRRVSSSKRSPAEQQQERVRQLLLYKMRRDRGFVDAALVRSRFGGALEWVSPLCGSPVLPT